MSSRAFRRTAIAGAAVATVLGTGTILVACGPDATPGAAGTAAAGTAAAGTAAGAARTGTAVAGAGQLSIADPYIPLPAGGAMAAGYLTVRNDGGEDRLLKVSSPGAASVTMHRSTDSSMEETGDLAVPAHGALDFGRGGNHLMIMGWSKPPAVGDELELDLTFAKAGTVAVRVPVKPLTYRPGQQD